MFEMIHLRKGKQPKIERERQTVVSLAPCVVGPFKNMFQQIKFQTQIASGVLFVLFIFVTRFVSAITNGHKWERKRTQKKEELNASETSYLVRGKKSLFHFLTIH